MTTLALLTAATIVRIVAGVTAEAGRWRICERLVGVAPEALGGRMFADQAEAGHVVVEESLCPVGRCMTIDARGAHRLAVHVVGSVAGIAAGVRIAVLAARLVATGAFSGNMFPHKRKVSSLVIESALVERHDVRVPTFMLDVAVRTVTAPRGPDEPVITGTGSAVIAHILVAVCAELTLFATLERNVTVAAFRLDIGVSGNNIARHHQRFELRPRRPGRAQAKHEQKSGCEKRQAHRWWSVHVHGEHVCQCRDDHHQEDR